MNVVIGKSLQDAQEFSEKWGIADPILISPQSLYKRFAIVEAGQMFVTKDAFSHPMISKTVQCVQRLMYKKAG